MDGFDASHGVIVLAATNRPDVLDSALLRPGRFDRRVPVQAPDKDGREQILRVHTRDVPLAPDVDLDALAAATAGMVGADLANLANEAALLAARREHEQVTMGDFSDALEKIELGTARKLLLTPADKRRTAYHEAGHALVGMLTPGADPVRKISIIPRTMSLGVTVSAPDADRFNYDKQSLLAHIKVATGGRAAEEVVYGDETTGAESDIRQATSLARNMVGRFGMSDEIGFLSVLPQDGDGSAIPATRRSPSGRGSGSTTRCAASSARPTTRRFSCSARTASGSSHSRRRCSKRRPSKGRRHTRRPGCDAPGCRAAGRARDPRSRTGRGPPCCRSPTDSTRDGSRSSTSR